MRWDGFGQFVRQTSFNTANLQSLQFREIALANGTSGQLYGNYAKQFDQWIDATVTNEFPVWYVSIILRIWAHFGRVSQSVRKISEIVPDEFIGFIGMTINFLSIFQIEIRQKWKECCEFSIECTKVESPYFRDLCTRLYQRYYYNEYCAVKKWHYYIIVELKMSFIIYSRLITLFLYFFHENYKVKLDK